MNNMKSYSMEPQEWDTEIRKYIQEEQEEKYYHLALALGLGSDPVEAYEYISRRPMPADLRKKYLSLGLPTIYEDPYFYPVLKKIFNLLQIQIGKPFTPKPFLATLPSGDVNALIAKEPKTQSPIIFFDHGLFTFFYDFANLTAWAMPPLSTEQLSDDSALANLTRKHTMPPQASKFFVAALYNYAVDGPPIATSSPIDKPINNLHLAIELLNYMEQFVFAHELAHIHENHLESLPTRQQEYEADALSLGLVSTLAYNNFGSWAIGYMACELVLIAFHFLYRAIGLLEFGPRKLTWISKTHPDPLSRREYLRGIWLEPNLPERGVAAARELCGALEAIFQRLWEFSIPMLIDAYQRGVRPSARWSKQMKSSFTTSKLDIGDKKDSHD